MENTVDLSYDMGLRVRAVIPFATSPEGSHKVSSWAGCKKTK